MKDGLISGSESSTARRYLLGEASEEECSAIEREYFRNEDAVEGIAAAEEALIEQYLSGRLAPGERGRFETHYLATPHHRRRVETIRQLTEVAGSLPRREAKDSGAWSSVARRVVGRRWFPPLAMAATMILVVAGAVWIFRPTPDAPRTAAQSAPAVSTSPAPAAPVDAPDSPVTPPSSGRVFALSISPVTVRSADESPSLVIPPGTDVVALRLEGENADKRLDHARAVVRTVAGNEVWRGPATVESDLPVGVVARIDLPAARLRVDDYVVELSGTDAAGLDQERYRYFLRVRAR